MKEVTIFQHLENLLSLPGPHDESAGGEIRLALWGLGIGLFSGSIISLFRITTSMAIDFVRQWFHANLNDPLQCAIWIIPAVLAALITGWLIRNPAIRSGAGTWVSEALAAPQKSILGRILVPKFLGTWLVMACGLSVGREGPCIQMGAATALGLAPMSNRQDAAKRRMFVLCGCAAGLAAAFSAPFAGIFYVFEVMKERIGRNLLILMLGSSLGVYLSATRLFGLGLMLPLQDGSLPAFPYIWNMAAVGLGAGLVGICYSWLLRHGLALFGRFRLPIVLHPILPFLAAGFMFFFYPQATGEGLSIFSLLESGGAISALLVFLGVKLLFTAFCYGSGVPAGVMVPVLAVGGVAGGLCAIVLSMIGLAGDGGMGAFIAIGMACAFAAAEHAPLTSMILVLEMTGVYSAAPGMLLAVACAMLLTRILRAEPV